MNATEHAAPDADRAQATEAHSDNNRRPQTLRDARAAYFAASGFDESTYTDDWVDLKVGPVPFRFPNTDGRKRTVPLHDLHHALTGYSAKLTGEMQIAAWEVGGGMKQHWVGWFLNLLTMSWGGVVRPRATFRAFVRGRRSTNLYCRPAEPGLIDRPVEAVRAERGIAPADQSQSASAGDLLAYAFWWLTALLVGAIGFVTLPLMLALGLWGTFQGRDQVQTP